MSALAPNWVAKPVVADADPDYTLDAPIFVVGCPRSGTTMLQAMLSASPACFSAPETHFFEVVAPARIVARAWPVRHKAPLPVLNETLLANWVMRFEALGLRSIDLHGTRSLAGVLAKIASAYIERAGQRFVEKTPYHLYYVDEIRALFPDARIIAIRREPEATIASMQRLARAQGKAPRSLFELARQWRRANVEIERQALFTVNYEALVEQPTKTLREICEHCGLDFHAVMVDGFQSQARTITASGENAWKANVGQALGVPRMTNRQLASQERALVRYYLGPWIRHFRYAAAAPLGAPAPGALAGDLLRFARVWARLEGHRVQVRLSVMLRHGSSGGRRGGAP